jgi:hypothetical protein
VSGRTLVAYARTAKAARALIAAHLCAPPESISVVWAPFDEMVTTLFEGRRAPGA